MLIFPLFAPAILPELVEIGTFASWAGASEAIIHSLEVQSLSRPEISDSLGISDARSFGGYDADILEDASASALADLDDKSGWQSLGANQITVHAGRQAIGDGEAESGSVVHGIGPAHPGELNKRLRELLLVILGDADAGVADCERERAGILRAGLEGCHEFFLRSLLKKWYMEEFNYKVSSIVDRVCVDSPPRSVPS